MTVGLPRTQDYGARLVEDNPGENAVNMSYFSSDPSWVVQRMNIAVEGLGYEASTTTDYLATVVVLIYLLLSLSHVVWTLKQQISSSSWDTAIELVLLAFNSPPEPALRGTSAQIHRWDTYKRIVKVRAEESDDTDTSGKPQLRLRLLLDRVDLDKKDEFSKGPKAKPAGITPAVGVVSNSKPDSNISSAGGPDPRT